MVKVRFANNDDSDAIAAVLRSAFGLYGEHYTPEAFAVVTPPASVIEERFGEGPQWVAIENGDVIGTVSVTVEDGDLYVRSMAVTPLSHGRGVGHKLLEAVDAYAATTGHERIFLYTTYFSTGAKELYEKHGYGWVRDTAAEEWFGVPGLEMDKVINV